MRLTREDIVRKDPRRTKVFVVPDRFAELGLSGKQVEFRVMTAGERGRFEAQFTTKKGTQRVDRLRELRERLIVETAVDEQGNRLLSPDDVKALAEKDGAFIDWLAQCAGEVNRISDDDLEELAKNSGPTPADILL